MADWVILPNIISDRGSKYAVSGVEISAPADIALRLKDLKRHKKFAKATHNSWAVLFADGQIAKNDDGEAGAGMAIAKVLEGASRTGLLVVVTRWYGGVNLGGDRFRHITQATQILLKDLHPKAGS